MERLPDLSEQLRSATPEVQRQIFDAFSLRGQCDRTQEVVRVSATVTEQVARALASGQLDPLVERGDGKDRTVRKPRGRAGADAELGVDRWPVADDELTSVVRGTQLMQHRVATTPSALGRLRRRQLVRLAQQAAGATLLGSPSLVIRHTPTMVDSRPRSRRMAPIPQGHPEHHAVIAIGSGVVLVGDLPPRALKLVSEWTG